LIYQPKLNIFGQPLSAASGMALPYPKVVKHGGFNDQEVQG
jgi:hypothetical protein